MNETHYSYGDVCYATVVDHDHLWGKVPSLVKPLPTLVIQITLAIVVNHSLRLIFHRLHQPRIVSDIITAIILSPSTLKHVNRKLGELIFPPQSFTIMETIANFGLVYAMFIYGMHTDLTPIGRKSTKTVSLACFAVVLSFTVGCATYLIFRSSDMVDKTIHNAEVVTIYWGTVIAATSFPTLAPILTNLKLLCKDIGREVLCLGLLSDIFSWFLILFTLAISTTSANDRHHIDSLSTALAITFMILFILFCALALRPIISKLVGVIPDGENYSDTTIQSLLFLVLACGFLTDLMGSHFMFGAFVLGMCIPNGVLADTLIEKIEDCILGVLLPLYFVVIGTRLDIVSLFMEFKYLWVVIAAVFTKLVCTFVCSLVLGLPITDGLSYGFLLSAKGLLPVLIIDIGLTRKVLPEDSFTMLLLIILLSTILVAPATSLLSKLKANNKHLYEQRTVEGSNPINKLKIITCVHTPRNVLSMVNVLELFNITSESPASVFALHLVELVGRASSMLIEHASRDSSSSASSWSSGGKYFFNRMRSQSNQIVADFQDFEDQHEETKFIQILTVVSPLDSMHEDICSLAEDKQANLIILPFHKLQEGDGKLEDTNIEFRAVNQSVMATAPCSIGLLVDRGLRISSLTSTSHITKSGKTQKDTRIAMVYIGGPDDREALTCAWRMSSHPCVTLTVICFIVGENAVDIPDDEVGVLTQLTQNEKERQIDAEFLWNFQQKVAHDDSIHYVEKVSNNGEETIELLRTTHQDFDLYIVGKGSSIVSPLTTGLTEWSDCPELGPIGDVVVTSDFAYYSSVLVIQQYSGGVKLSENEDLYIEDEIVLVGNQLQP